MYRYIMRRDEEYVEKIMMRMDVEEKGRKTKEEVDRQCKCVLEGEWTVGGGDPKLGCVEVTGHKQWEKMW